MQVTLKGWLVGKDDYDDDIRFYDPEYGSGRLLGDTLQQQLLDEDVTTYCDSKNRLGHRVCIINNCFVRLYVSDEELTLEEAEICLASKFDGKFFLDTDLTGYSEWTITGMDLNTLECGGHSILEELKSYYGKYIILVIEW